GHVCPVVAGRRNAGPPGPPGAGMLRPSVAAGADVALLHTAAGPLVEPLPHAILRLSASCGRARSGQVPQPAVILRKTDRALLDRRGSCPDRAVGNRGRLPERASLGQDAGYGVARLGPRDLLPSLDRRPGLHRSGGARERKAPDPGPLRAEDERLHEAAPGW